MENPTIGVIEIVDDYFTHVRGPKNELLLFNHKGLNMVPAALRKAGQAVRIDFGTGLMNGLVTVRAHDGKAPTHIVQAGDAAYIETATVPVMQGDVLTEVEIPVNPPAQAPLPKLRKRGTP